MSTKYADVILHVADASDPELDMHMQVVYDTLRALDISGKPVITAFNKTDLPDIAGRLTDERADEYVRISAKTGQGTDRLLEIIEDTLQKNRRYVEGVISYSDGGMLAFVHKYGTVIEEEYTEEGIRIKAYLPASVRL